MRLLEAKTQQPVLFHFKTFFQTALSLKLIEPSSVNKRQKSSSFFTIKFTVTLKEGVFSSVMEPLELLAVSFLQLNNAKRKS